LQEFLRHTGFCDDHNSTWKKWFDVVK